MFPVCLRYVLTFLLLTAAAPQGASLASARATEPTSVDEAPAESVSIGNKTPEPTAAEPFTLCIALPPRTCHWPRLAPVPAPVRPPRSIRRASSRRHWVRRRVPRLRDDAPDH